MTIRLIGVMTMMNVMTVTIFVFSRSSSDLMDAAGAGSILTGMNTEEGGIFTSTGTISTTVSKNA
jgi:hypothetical protein